MSSMFMEQRDGHEFLDFGGSAATSSFSSPLNYPYSPPRYPESVLPATNYNDLNDLYYPEDILANPFPSPALYDHPPPIDPYLYPPAALKEPDYHQSTGEPASAQPSEPQYVTMSEITSSAPSSVSDDEHSESAAVDEKNWPQSHTATTTTRTSRKRFRRSSGTKDTVAHGLTSTSDSDQDSDTPRKPVSKRVRRPTPPSRRDSGSQHRRETTTGSNNSRMNSSRHHSRNREDEADDYLQPSSSDFSVSEHGENSDSDYDSDAASFRSSRRGKRGGGSGKKRIGAARALREMERESARHHHTRNRDTAASSQFQINPASTTATTTFFSPSHSHSAPSSAPSPLVLDVSLPATADSINLEADVNLAMAGEVFVVRDHHSEGIAVAGVGLPMLNNGTSAVVSPENVSLPSYSESSPFSSSNLAVMSSHGTPGRKQTIPAPIPVPHLTKKSRGRKVPVDFDADDNDDQDISAVSATYSSTAASTMDLLHSLPKAKIISGGIKKASGDRRYVCTVEGCGKCFVRGEHLKRHVRSLHTYEKPHTCPYHGCGKTFSRRDNLAQHVKVHL